MGPSGGAYRKHMAQMSIAHMTRDFDPMHAVAVIQMIGNDPWNDRLREARPPRMALILVHCIEKLGTATDAFIPTRLK
jgi:hypothetical protein